MFPSSADVEQEEKNTAAYWAQVEKAFSDAMEILQGRTSTRDLFATPWAKMAFGVQSYVTFIFHKACRLASMVQVENPDAVLEAKIDDEILDMINYLAMLRAHRKLAAGSIAEAEEKEKINDAPPPRRVL